MNKRFSAHLDLAKSYWEKQIEEGDIVIDATCGNGHDTLFLAKLPSSNVFSIDIQTKAIQSTQKLIESHGLLKKVTLCYCSHESFEKLNLPRPPKLIIYNLGYLPGGNKHFTTQTKSTLTSLNEAILILAQNGAISITCYPGHEEGKREEIALLAWSQNLCPKKWIVSHHQWINRERSPSVLWIERAARHNPATLKTQDCVGLPVCPR